MRSMVLGCALLMLTGCAAAKFNVSAGTDLGAGTKVELVNTADNSTIASAEVKVSPSSALSALTMPALGLWAKVKALLGL